MRNSHLLANRRTTAMRRGHCIDLCKQINVSAGKTATTGCHRNEHLLHFLFFGSVNVNYAVVR